MTTTTPDGDLHLTAQQLSALKKKTTDFFIAAIKRIINLQRGNTHLSVSTFKDHSKCAMPYQVLPTELKFPHRLHVEPKSLLLHY